MGPQRKLQNYTDDTLYKTNYCKAFQFRWIPKYKIRWDHLRALNNAICTMYNSLKRRSEASNSSNDTLIPSMIQLLANYISTIFQTGLMKTYCFLQPVQPYGWESKDFKQKKYLISYYESFYITIFYFGLPSKVLSWRDRLKKRCGRSGAFPLKCSKLVAEHARMAGRAFIHSAYWGPSLYSRQQYKTIQLENTKIVSCAVARTAVLANWNHFVRWFMI